MYVEELINDLLKANELSCELGATLPLEIKMCCWESAGERD